MRGSDLGILGIVILGSLALFLAFITMLVNRDAEVIKGALVVAGVAGSAISGLTGFIAGAHSVTEKTERLAQPSATLEAK